MFPAIKVPLYQVTLVFDLSADGLVDAGSRSELKRTERAPAESHLASRDKPHSHLGDLGIQNTSF